MENIKLTQKQINGLILIDKVGRPICSQELLDKYSNDLQEKGFDKEKINSINATEASNATKGLLLKEKKVYKDKLCTFYSLTELGRQVLDNLKESK